MYNIFNYKLAWRNNMKIAVSSYSYGSYAYDDKLGILGAMDHAKSLGFSGIEIDGNEYTTNKDIVFKIRNHSERIGLPVIGLDVGANFTKDDCRAFAEEIELVKKHVDIAHDLGAPIMRHDVSYGGFSENSGITFESCLPLMADCCKEVADYAAKRGVKTMFENHGFFIQHHERVKKLIEAADHENFGYLMDIGNYLCADDDPITAVKSLIKYADHVHIKDFHYSSKENAPEGNGWFKTLNGNYLKGAVAGEGCVNVSEIIKILNDSGYTKYLTLEFEGTEDNLIGIESGFKFISSVIERI